jgi:hypothetical protein
MKSPRSALAVAAAVGALSLVPSVAQAACTPGATTGCQQVTGTVISSTLSFGSVAPIATLSTIAPGATTTGVGAIPVVSVGGWTLKVADDNTSATAGRMAKGAVPSCTGSAANLNNPLQVYPTALGGLDTFTTSFTSGARHALDATATTIATGTASDTVTANYSVAIDTSEQLAAACTYSLNAVYTLTP